MANARLFKGELQRNQQPAITSMFLKHLTLNNMHGDRHFQLGNNSLEHYKKRRPPPAPRNPFVSSVHGASNNCTLPYHFKIYIVSELCLTSTTCVPAPTYRHPSEARISCGLFCFLDFFDFCYRSCY
ncbi:hypothetical protein NC651_001289 [Populus alba x Populus x berolinensis]|nr:hypothetical protein NC651_001289 [Populus alba x Populus x berolinensis]